MSDIQEAVWSTAYINNLPDSCFLFIESGGEKDEEGKTKPRSLRHFPYKDSDGKVDLPHLRNAISRIPQSTVEGLDKDKLQEKARRILEENTDKSVEKIDSGDLAGGGQRGAAHFGESFLAGKKGVGILVLKEELDVFKSDVGQLLIRAEKCSEGLDASFLVMSNNLAHGTMKLSAPFEMSFEEVLMTQISHGVSTVRLNTIKDHVEKFYGYRILEKNFEGNPLPIEVVEMNKTTPWICNVIPLEKDSSKIAVKIFKAMTDDERIVAAAVLVPNVPDLNGDIYDGPTVRKAAYSFMENYRDDSEHGINVMHQGKKIEKAIRVLQSFVLDVETTYECELTAATDDHLSQERKSVTYPADTWIMYAKILSDELWEAAKVGEFTGWSIQGYAKIETLKN